MMGLSITLARAAAMAAALVVLCGLHPALAQTGTVSGTVTDNAGAALADADVRVEGTFLHASSDANGRFTISGVPPGERRLRVLLLGYRAGTKAVTVTAGGTVQADFSLERTPIPLEAM